MTTNTPQLDQLLAEKLPKRFPLSIAIRAINEGIEHSTRSIAPLNVELVHIETVPDAPPVWTLARSASTRVKTFRDFTRNLASVGGGAADTELNERQRDQLAWSYFQKFTRSTACTRICALGVLALTHLLKHKYELTIGSSVLCDVTVIQTRVVVPTLVSPVLKFVDAESGALLEPVSRLYHSMLLVTNAQSPREHASDMVEPGAFLTFHHRWLVLTLRDLSNNAVRFMHLDLAGPALNEFMSDSTLRDSVSYDTDAKLPFVVFFDDDLPARALQAPKYDRLLNRPTESQKRMFNPRELDTFVRAAQALSEREKDEAAKLDEASPDFRRHASLGQQMAAVFGSLISIASSVKPSVTVEEVTVEEEEEEAADSIVSEVGDVSEEA